MAQWLRLGASIAGGTGSVPGLGTKVPRAVGLSKKNAVVPVQIAIISQLKLDKPQFMSEACERITDIYSSHCSSP